MKKVYQEILMQFCVDDDVDIDEVLFEMDIDITPEKAFSHYDLGLLFKADGKLLNARKHLEVALKLNPQYPYTCAALREVYVMLGKPELIHNTSCNRSSDISSVQIPQTITNQ